MSNPTLNPAVMTVHCNRCLAEIPEGQGPSEYGRPSVGVTANGDLVIWCVRHDELISIHKQGEIDAAFRAVVNRPCSGCGEVHSYEDKEMLH